MTCIHSTLKGGVLLGAGLAASYVVWRYSNVNHACACDSSDPGEDDVIKVADSDHKLLVLGLDGSGKSTLISALANKDWADGSQNAEEERAHVPTQGFNIISVQTNDVSLNIWEIGGSLNMRQYWGNFLSDVRALVYVVDASDSERFAEATAELTNLLNNVTESIPLLIVGSKQDLIVEEKFCELYQDIQSKFADLPFVSSIEATCVSIPANASPEGLDTLHNMLTEIIDT